VTTAGNKKLYRTAKVCELLEISRKTLYSLEARHIIPQAPRDWRGWRGYNDSHLEAIRKYQASKNSNGELNKKGES